MRQCKSEDCVNLISEGEVYCNRCLKSPIDKPIIKPKPFKHNCASCGADMKHTKIGFTCSNKSCISHL